MMQCRPSGPGRAHNHIRSGPSRALLHCVGYTGLTIAQRSTTVPFVDTYSYRSTREAPSVDKCMRPKPYVVPRTRLHAGVGVMNLESITAPAVAWLMYTVAAGAVYVPLASGRPTMVPL